jgi:hypothetical protein
MLQMIIADVIFRIEYDEPMAIQQFSNYICDDHHQPDVIINAKRINGRTRHHYIFREIARALKNESSFFLHSSAVVLNNEAFVFTAPSGTGKSTHSKLWVDTFQGSTFILNDDLPILKPVREKMFIYGSPWAGQNHLQVNDKAEVSSICFIEQASENWVNRIDSIEALPLLMRQLYILNQDSSTPSTLLHFLDRLFQDVPMFRMGCTISKESVFLAYRVLKRVNK